MLRDIAIAVGPELRLKSALIFRTVASLSSYLLMALSYTLVNLAFGIPMERRFGRAGPVLYWMLNTCTMGAGNRSLKLVRVRLSLIWK